MLANNDLVNVDWRIDVEGTNKILYDLGICILDANILQLNKKNRDFILKNQWLLIVFGYVLTYSYFAGELQFPCGR